MAALLAYAFLLEPIGYPLATAAVFVAIARLLGSRAIVRDVIVGLVLGFGLYHRLHAVPRGLAAGRADAHLLT